MKRNKLVKKGVLYSSLVVLGLGSALELEFVLDNFFLFLSYAKFLPQVVIGGTATIMIIGIANRIAEFSQKKSNSKRNFSENDIPTKLPELRIY